jgi:hypothetical protein
MKANHSMVGLLQTTLDQLHGDEFWSQEDKGLVGSRLMLDLNEIKASLSLAILTPRNIHLKNIRTNNEEVN